MEVVFWICASLILANLAVVPAAVIVLSYIFPRPSKKDSAYLPSMTVLITAHNEERHIRAKIENTLALDYPPDRLEVLLALDGCNDRTAAIAGEFADRGVRVLDFRVRRGKTAAQDDAIDESRSEVVLFTDATAYLDSRAARELAAHLADPKVGCSTGWPLFTAPTGAGSAGVAARSGYEMFLRRRLGLLHSMLGAAGAIMLMRKADVVRIGRGLNHDYAAPMEALLRGGRTVLEPNAKAYMRRPLTDADELSRRTRIVAQGIGTVLGVRGSFNFLRHPVTAFLVVTLRLLKWLVPELLIGLFISNLTLLSEPMYRLTLAAQILFYLLAGSGLLFADRRRLPRVISVPFYFCLLNLAALRGTLSYLRRERYATWQATSR